MTSFSSFSRPGSAGVWAAAGSKPGEESKESVSFFTPSSSSSLKQRAIYSEMFIKRSDSTAAPQPSSPQYALSPTSSSAQHSSTPPSSLPISTFTGEQLPPPPPVLSAASRDGTRAPSALHPKVMVPFTHQSTSLPPRRIAIERKRREFASQSLAALLRSHGIDYGSYSPQHDHSTGLPSFLSLHLFDDDEYESFTPQQWLQHGPLPAKALRLDEQGRGDYAACTVTAYTAASEQWQLTFDKSELSTSLHRLFLCFDVEDPCVYAARVAAAHSSRRSAEATLRSALYVDCMPIDELTVMDAEQVNRVLFLALNTKKMRINNSDTTSLINEMHLDYSRTINSIIYQAQTRDAAHSAAAAAVVPYSATVSIPPHDFAGHFSSFCFHSFLTKAEAISGLQRVNVECQKLRGQQLFVSQYSKSVRVEEFASSQHSCRHQLVSHLHDKLLHNIASALRQSLKDVDKGWLNLKEQSREIFNYGKLSRLMTRVNYAIADTVRTQVQLSLTDYARMVERTCRHDVVVSGMKDIRLSRRQPDGSSAVPASAPDAPPPLFTVDLLFKDSVIQYSTSPAALAASPLEVFDAAFAALCRLPQIESFCLPQLFPVNNLSYISAVQREEPEVEALAQRLRQLLAVAVAPLSDYIALYSVHLPFLLLNVDDHCKELQKAGHDNLEAVKREIASYSERKAEVEAAIPRQVNLGLCLVNCEDVRRKVVNKYGEMVSKLLELLQRLARARCDDVTKQVKKLEADIKRVPIDIVELTKLREFLQSVPSAVNALKTAIYSDVMSHFDALDGFQVKVSKELYKLKYAVVAYPKQLVEMTVTREAQLQQDSAVFLQEMRQQQEELNGDIADIEKRINSVSHLHDFEQLDRVNERCEQLQQSIATVVARSRQYNSNESLFPATATTDYALVTALSRRFDDYYLLFTTAYQWQQHSAQWRYGPFLELNADSIQSCVDGYHKNILKVLKAKQIKDNVAHLSLASACKRELDAFKAVLPLVLALRNVGMKERHWKILSDKLPYNFSFMMKDKETEAADALSVPSSASASAVPGAAGGGAMTLHKLLEEYQLQNSLELISKVSDVATREFGIETSLQRMEEAWRGVEFTIAAYKATGSYVVKGVDEVVAQLDEHIMTTQAMQFSPYKRVFDDRIARWVTKLNTVSEVIEEWLAVQKLWLNLQSIFASPDINKQLPAEGKRFTAVNKSWRLIMSQAHAAPDVLTFADSPSLLTKLKDGNATLTAIQKKLSDYLDKKRSLFPRFYFLANEELLAILSQTADPLAVQPHLKKCFENVDRLEFSDGGAAGQLITAMLSAEGERVEFLRPIAVKDRNVEDWLGEVEAAMKAGVRHWMNAAIAAYAAGSRSDWVRAWPGQTVLNGSQFHWTMEMERALREGGHDGLLRYQQRWLAQLADMVELVRGKLSRIQSLILGALIVLDVHARDVHERLVGERVASVDDFGWICQLRYYAQDESLFVQMVQSRFPYGYEYLGNTARLVITPLTDRCYLTLMSAISLHLGGAPSGPAGTGKTETVKDLAKAVAKYCVVFNCSDGLNYQAMGKFFKGLASSGSWACFDEFNRIEIEVLSVVAQQIMTIWAAVRENAEHFIFEGADIRLDPTVSVFITMNPGYAGRTELPDNLECLFRPVAMMVPDYALIAEIMLYSFGFQAAPPLARKMVATFKLCSEQLSSQDHYDYGMRAVKTVITRAGILKAECPAENEELLLLRALHDVNVPKFLKPDLPLFEGIISDLFPGLQGADSRDVQMLRSALVAQCSERHLQPVDAFLDKCVQLYDTTVVRHGVMLVGPAGGGKSSNLRTLSAAMTSLSAASTSSPYQRVIVHTLNPKSITQEQLYGGVDRNTQEWQDGILAGIVRECIADTTTARKWVVFDGPVDAVWIENMNTVLDDNKKLCLVSGEILTLSSSMTMLFEVEDLSVASPATVSRCGMVYMDSAVLGVQPLLDSFRLTLHPALKDFLPSLSAFFSSTVQAALSFVRRECTEPVATCDNNLVRSFLNILSALLRPFIPSDESSGSSGAGSGGSDAVAGLQAAVGHSDCLCLLALVWSVGGSIDAASRVRFSQRLRELRKDSAEPMPADGTVYDYTYSLQQQRWQLWSDSVPAYRWDDKLTFNEIVVPTADSIRHTQLLDMLTRQGCHVLFTGSTGTGKTVNIAQYFARLDSAYLPVNVIFSAATTANQLDDTLMAKMSKRRQRVYGPPLGKTYLVFIDDLNMPAREKYGAQPPLELIRQYLDHGGWYDRRLLSFTELVDIQIVGAMAPPGGGRNVVSPRLLRHFNQVYHVDMDKATLSHIYSLILTNSLLRFSEEIRGMASTLVQATLEVYSSIQQTLLPTPNKSHYCFNLRDLAAVFQGMLGGSPQRVASVPAFLRLWMHENRRVFRDRLVDSEDRRVCDELLSSVLQQQFSVDWANIAPDSGHCLLFGNYLDGSSAGDARHYEEGDLSRAQKVMEERLLDYNDEHTPMRLTLFHDCIEHVSRIARVLRQPGGNALLLGVGGSGRQSLTRLACYMSDYALFQVEMSKQYGMNEWRDDMRRLLLDSGLKEQSTVFLVTDSQLSNELCFNDINSILNCQEIPGLYSPEDVDSIFATCKADCQRKNIAVSRGNAYAQFLLRVKANLHVVLCMSPASAAFRTRLRMYPALVNCCTIDWFSDWPEQALSSVAESSLADDELKLEFDSKSRIVSMMQTVHTTVAEQSLQYREELRRYNYVTPTSYLELLSIFKSLLHDKRGEIGGKRAKLQNGLNKLDSASRDIAQLQSDLTEKQPRLVETQREVESTMIAIDADKKDAAVTKEAVEQQSREAELKAAECKSMRDAAQTELDKALPLLDKAVECLSELNKTHIDEVRNFKKPPPAVVLTMEAACIMLRHVLKLKVSMKPGPDPAKKVPDYWETAQKYLLKTPKVLLDTLQSYDKENIPDEVLVKIRPYIEREDFAVKVVEKASQACRAICMWVHAMYQFSLVNAEVEPLRLKLKDAEAELEAVMIRLNDAKERMRQVEERLASLESKYDSLVAESEALRLGVEQCQVKLQRAEKLISGLGGEKERWVQSVASLSVSYDAIIGDVLIAASTIAYLGAFTSDYRQQLTEQWRQLLRQLDIAHSEQPSILRTLGDPVQVRAWTIAGLPTDSVSIENGIIMSKARRWPLMIDPQGQAVKFIRKLGLQRFEDGMQVVKLSDKGLLSSFENAVRFGRWILLEGVQEELDPALEPLLLQQVVNVKGQPHIKLGESLVPYNDQFHLYITTKLPNPHYAPELQVKVTLLNFTCTPSGLTDQMLGTVVAKEQPELESKKNALVISNAKMKKALADTEDAILRMLNEASGDILDDSTLIDTLATSKKTSQEIAERVQEAELVEMEIDTARRAYVTVAERASILYFCIADLAAIDPMYQYSLTWFVLLFVAAIQNAPTPAVEADAGQSGIEARLSSLNAYFTQSLYVNVSRSLFEPHKLLFSFLLTVRILQHSGSIQEREWKFLVTGAAGTKKTAAALSNPAPAWLTDGSWSAILSLSELPSFAGLDAAFVSELELLQAYCSTADPYEAALPAAFTERLSDFQRLLVLRCLRPDKMTAALSVFVSRHMGASFVDSPPFSLPQLYADSSSTTPIIFILSRGADPTSKLLQYALDAGYRDRTVSISLGQGQGPIAEKHIADGVRRGGWVILQNCHLALSWLPTLEKLLAELKAEDVHADFRLFITSMPSPAFPVSILQNGVKVTNEPPKGVKANLTRSYHGLTDDDVVATSRPTEYRKLLYALCFFHAVLLERRRFGPLGFNIPYFFNETDLSVCVSQLREFVQRYADIPYQVIHFLAYDINYGGRVTDDIDRRCVATVLDDFITPEIMRDDYCFSSSPLYRSLPALDSRAAYLSAIAGMESQAPPEVFGLHSNADIVSAQEEAMAMLSTILGLLPRTVNKGEKSREAIIAEVVDGILSTLPPLFDLQLVQSRFPTVYNESMNTVLVQEAIRYNRLLATIASSLSDVQRALMGSMGMAEQLEQSMQALYLNLVPEAWLKHSYPSLMPLAAYCADLKQRCRFLSHWVQQGLPAVMWMSGFFFPQAFLTGALQNYARKHQVSIDTVSFSFQVRRETRPEDITERVSDGVLVSGLQLQGARWDSDSNSLVDSRPKELFVSFPIIHLLPSHTPQPARSPHVYRCPVYKTLTRAGTLSTTGHSTNFVLFIDVPSAVPAKKWVKAGVALFCALRY